MPAKKKKGISPIKAVKPPMPAPLPRTERGPDIRFWSKGEVLERVGLSFPTVWKLMRAGTFPRARYLGPQKTMWIASEIEDWIMATPLRRFKGEDEKVA
jgi:prophage regulatory protein